MIEPLDLSRAARLVGCVLGGAVGDALGAPVEFMSREEILRAFGPKGITQYAPAYGRIGAITDDTQMTLFTIEGLVRGYRRGATKGIVSLEAVIDHAYRRWYRTQTARYSPEAIEPFNGWLIALEGLWSARAPGLTCLAALAAKDSERFGEPAQNDSKGAAGVMRVAPLGILARHPFELACNVAGLTHGHVTGKVAAGWFAEWIHGISIGIGLEAAAQGAWRVCRGRAPELDAALAAALALAGKGARPVVPAELGLGWIAEEAAAIALWCVLTATSPLEALLLAVNIDGDSDTTGSLVGQVCGAAFGVGWLGPEWLDPLELRAEMTELVEDAVGIVLDQQGRDDSAMWERYPPS